MAATTCNFLLYVLYLLAFEPYTGEVMGTITTRQNQRDTASAARRVGGYSELIRLSAERTRSNNGTVTRNAATGQWTVTRRDG